MLAVQDRHADALKLARRVADDEATCDPPHCAVEFLDGPMRNVIPVERVEHQRAFDLPLFGP